MISCKNWQRIHKFRARIITSSCRDDVHTVSTETLELFLNKRNRVALGDALALVCRGLDNLARP
jgi:hypothetical protein